MATATPRVRINGERLNATLQETCEWGAAFRTGDGPFETGMNRLALTDDDAAVRRWFVAEAEKLGCKVSIDQMGNIFAVRKGKADGPPTAMGSHLDTQPKGGRYDGILGVNAALEVLRTLHDYNVETEYPVAAIDWTNEEGARFPKMMSCSAVWAGLEPLDKIWNLKELGSGGATMKAELERTGFLGTTPCSHVENPLAAHFELHIEQGPILEATGRKVGVVLGGKGIRWYNIIVEGRESHTGSTPFSSRSDAMLCAAKIIVSSNRIAAKHEGLASTGVFNLQPGSINSIPGHVKFSMDLRHLDDGKMQAMEDELRARASEIAEKESERGCTVTWEVLNNNPTIHFNKDTVECVRASARAAVQPDLVAELYSGPGHDSCMAAAVIPTAMIFVPSRDGLSHTPLEYTSPEDCALGAQVLLDAVLNFDARRTAKAS